jgi:hypothetical protein
LAIIFDDIDKQRCTERQPGFTVKPTIEPKTVRQHRRAGGASAHGRGWRTDWLSPSTISADGTAGRLSSQAHDIARQSSVNVVELATCWHTSEAEDGLAGYHL